MTNISKYLYITLFLKLFLASIIYCSETINFLDHKNSQLNLYLDLIKYNIEEKLGILPYILKKPDGSYLEIGTGGDPIAQLLSKIPDTASAKIIASDIDQNILDSLPIRHPILRKYFHNNPQGPSLKLQQLDATSMKCFENNSLDGINASAIVHEIVSYAGGIEGLNKFFSESLRVLKPDGVLIYRDPESVSDKLEFINLELKTPPIRLFSHIFIYKFLDKTHGNLSTSARKQILYDPSNIMFTFYKKNDGYQYTATYEEYNKIQSHEIDFSRKYSLKIPRGLCREIERHYLTYLHQCNPLAFITFCPHITSDSYSINYLAHSTPLILEDFLKKNGQSYTDGLIDTVTKRKISTAIIDNTKVIEYGIPLYLPSKNKQFLLWNLLKEHMFDPSLNIIPLKDNYYILDYRIFGILYDSIINLIFDPHNRPVNKEDSIHAEWLKREGEETYIYYSDDELITKVGEISLEYNTISNEDFILCPLSTEQNKFIPRRCYEQILKNSIFITDKLGFFIPIKEGKRVIHFQKMNIKEALSIYQEIIKTNPEQYTHLQKLTNKLLQNKNR